MPSAWARLERLFLRVVVRPLLARGTYADWRRRLVATPAPFGVRILPALVGGVPGEWLLPEDAGDDRPLLPARRRLRDRRAAALPAAWRGGWRRRSTRARSCSTIGWRPSIPFPAALDDCVAGYRALVARGVSPSDIVIAGDSAGGALALATLVVLRDAGDELPAAAALLSPLTQSHAERPSRCRRASRPDPLLTPEFCGWSPRSTSVTPAAGAAGLAAVRRAAAGCRR